MSLFTFNDFKSLFTNKIRVEVIFFFGFFNKICVVDKAINIKDLCA